MNIMNMKTKGLVITLLLLSLATAGPAVAQVKKTPLPEKYKTWLDEEVVYIITPIERDVFLKLSSDRERDMFIEAFWKHRDTNPLTEENEFKKEHYRRIEYANRYLGRETFIPGWKTDRGRIYIILGEPREKVRYDASSDVCDCETWFYQGLTNLGLPEGFYLIFFKQPGSGAYRLYSPMQDGPQALLMAYSGDPMDYVTAYKKLYQAEPTLAGLSMSLIPGEQSSTYSRPSLTSDMMLQTIEAVPSKTVESAYAKKFLDYKDVISVEYSANYIDNNSLIKVFRDSSGYYFLHLCVEPQKLSVDENNGKYLTTLDVNYRVSDPAGRSVYQFDRKVAVALSEDQMKWASPEPYNFHDIFPIVPGDYNISLLIKNEASKEFTSVARTVRVPGGAAVQITQPVLGYKLAWLAPGERRIKPFRIGSCQIFCQPSRIFTSGDTMAIAFQVILPAGEASADGRIKIAFYQNNKLFREIVHRPSECPELPDIVEEVALRDFPSAHYEVQISYSGSRGEVSASEEFDLTYATAVPRPWSTTRVLPDANDAFYPYVIGIQLLNLGRAQEAKEELERAIQKRPDLEEIAVSLARACMSLGKSVEARRIIEPFVGADKTPKYEAMMLSADACRATGDNSAALALLERAVSRYGGNAVIMNALGENYLAAGRRSEALAAFRQSIAFDPNQPELKKKIGELEKNK